MSLYFIVLARGSLSWRFFGPHWLLILLGGSFLCILLRCGLAFFLGSRLLFISLFSLNFLLNSILLRGGSVLNFFVSLNMPRRCFKLMDCFKIFVNYLLFLFFD
jgi:hypothetical protein